MTFLALMTGKAVGSDLRNVAALAKGAVPARPEAIARWRDMRFGMFIHWGPVSLTGREIGWSRGKQVPADVYDNLYKRFNPVKFNADEWVAVAKAAGMKYIVLTTKHHDGFCLWDSKETDYDIMNTPFGRDVVRELSDACRRGGIAFGAYYSTCDWYNPDFPVTSPGGKTERAKHDLDRYTGYMKAQVRELLANYGPLLCMWHDVPQRFDARRGAGVINMERAIQPDILVNNRTGHPGDFDTPEQRIGAFQFDRPWETYMTICRQWAWKPNDEMKSLATCLHTLMRTVGGDGNLLFNVGPQPDGLIEPRQVARLKEMGDWIARHADAVYGTRGGPWKPSPIMTSTRRGDRIYLCFMTKMVEPAVLEGLPLAVTSARVLSDGSAVKVEGGDNALTVHVQNAAWDGLATVIELTVAGDTMTVQPLEGFAQPSIPGATATASAVYENRAAYSADKVLDGDVMTRWATPAGTRKAWLRIDLGKETTFSGVRMDEECCGCSSRVKKWALQRLDGKTWTTVCEGGRIGAHFEVSFEPVTTRALRLEIIDASEGPTFSEFKILGSRGNAKNELPPWRTPAVNSINRLEARAIAVPCETEALALAVAKGEKPRTASKWIKSLNGTWDFKWKSSILQNEWEKECAIAVPGCWQLQGDFDPPLYTNSKYPIPNLGNGDPMGVPDKKFTSYRYRNPVGLYSRRFSVSADWEPRRTVIHFGGVSSAMYVRLNGREVGYSEDSRLPAEFDLTPYLVKGENLLEVEVIKHCDGTFLEDQDFWRLSGIFRDVWLVSEDNASTKDLIVETGLSDDYSKGELVVRDEKGAVLLRKTYDKPALWSCESPNMYYETVRYACGDYRAVAFGFRKVEIKDSVIFINGRRALFMGVNRHEMQPESGYVVTLEGMKRDIEIMKSLNINAVRTCHYPDDPIWYELCDRAGLYVVCEANIESHGSGYGKGSYAKKPAFLQTHVERGVNMVKTFRNHPSVVIWSMGNEAGFGDNFIAQYKAMRALDPTRPIQYEQARNTPWSDVCCPMYSRPWSCEKYVKNNPKKPFVLCEYSHAMGNSCGDIHDYWKLVRKYPSMQGGFIWDFADQALWKTDRKGRFLAYGGDFGDRPNDDNFCCNGLTAADRTLHPSAFEAKHAYQPVKVDAWDWTTKTAKIYNAYRFTSLENVVGRWAVSRDGKQIAAGTMDLKGIGPDSVKEIRIAEAPDGDAVLFTFSRPENGSGRIAHDEFVKPFAPVEKPVADTAVSLGKNPFRINLWRAPIDNDRGWKMPAVCAVWKQATVSQAMPDGVESKLDAKRLADGRILVDWSLSVRKVKADSKLPPIPRVGLTFAIPKDFTDVEWYGEGPFENYSDRANFSTLGSWSAKVGVSSGVAGADGCIKYVGGPSVALNPDNYVEPGEQGYRTQCRWVAFTNGEGRKIRVTALNAPFGFNAWPYTQEDLEKARHQRDLKARDEITVNIDAVQMGVGGDNSWGARPHGDDMPGEGVYTLSFVVEGL